MRNQFLFAKRDLKSKPKQKELTQHVFQRFSKFQPTRKRLNKVKLAEFSTQKPFSNLCIIA